MELRLPTPEQLRTVYDRDLKTSFPAAELKPLRNIEKSWDEGWYRPYCLFDGDNIVARRFSGWAIPAGRRWVIHVFPAPAVTAALAPCFCKSCGSGRAVP